MATRTSLLILALSCPAFAADWEPPQPAGKVPSDRLHVPEGLEVTVWATSPDLFNPTNLDIDHAGRIWVAEGVNYRSHNKRRPEGDRIVVLQDTDGDGKADSSHTFVQDPELIAPLGIAVFDHKIVVSQPPHLLVYTDVDRNLKFDPAIDKKEVLLTGFNAINHDHSLHAVIGGPDGYWYLNQGNTGAIFTDRSGKTFRMAGDYYQDGGGIWPFDTRPEVGKASDDGFVWTPGFSARMHPDGSQVEIIGHGYRNSYEHANTSYGDLFQNDNDDYGACRTSYVLEYGSAGYFTREGRRYTTVARPGQPIARAHWRQDDPGTFDAGDVYGGGAPTGIVFYENGALGEAWNGTLLSADAARNVVFGYRPEPQGAAFKLESQAFITSNVTGQFAGTDFTGGSTIEGDDNHVLFRPSDVAVGADGAMYVSDWYDARVGGHGDRDDSCSGTIYRIAPKGFTPQVPAIDFTTTEGQIAALRSPAVNVRWSGFQGLKAQGEAALPAVQALLQDPNPWIAARAIWLLPYLGEKGLEACTSLLSSDRESQRLVAYRALKRSGQDILPYARQLANDPSAAVRRDVALSLRTLPAEQSAPILFTIAQAWDGKDKNYLEAIGLGAAPHEDQVWQELRKAFSATEPLRWSDAFARLTWRLWPASAVPDLKARASAHSLTAEQRKLAVESISFINTPQAADVMFELAQDGSPSKDDAISWLFVRGTGPWAGYQLAERLKASNIYDPDNIRLTEIIIPAKPKDSQFQVEDVLKLKGNAEQGKTTAMRCVMCHRINDAGPNYGPDLKGWVSRQGAEMAALSIIDPSADIAHGFDGTAVQYDDGKWIDGLILSLGDPIVIISTGGVKQTVPRKRIKSTHRMDRSLMLSADQLGLSAQDVADVIEWLKTY